MRNRAWQNRKRLGRAAISGKQRWWMIVNRRPQSVRVASESQKLRPLIGKGIEVRVLWGTEWAGCCD